ncbi:protein UPSTREAM OF FLC isoform X3 [Quercus lobata]|nr:protein UPSTREAM OF FLC isoform X3 [Quercus lobata]XP_030961985.1 protein UPSTREAM OF FLC isoform X3 [Quercus lobata]
MEAKGGEVRRLHIIYFLSHMGRVEHPHLVRVHHFNRNGVYLRDVKRWLSDLRGKDMPEAFTWSYKRRYKTGYVWQDLLDDDLITPISDNEYVLKGSEIINTPFEVKDHGSHSEKKASILKKQQPVEVGVLAEEQHLEQPLTNEEYQTQPDSKVNTSTEFSSEITEESTCFGSERSTLANDSPKLEEEKQEQSEKFETTSFYSALLSRKNKKKSNKNKEENAGTPASAYSSSSSSKSSFTKSKTYSGGASSMIRNFIRCGAVDTNDAVLIMMNRANRTKTCEEEILGGHGTNWNQEEQQQQQQQQKQQHQEQQKARESYDGGHGSQKKHSEFSKQKAVNTAYKPVAGPNCSQCGKSFKPEKMHEHMKSCRGMKALAKTAAVNTEKAPSAESMTSSHRKSTSGYFLTN